MSAGRRSNSKPAHDIGAFHPDGAVIYLDQFLDEMVATLRRLVEAESPSFDKAAVDRLGFILARDFARLGGHVRWHKARDFGNHLQVDFAPRYRHAGIADRAPVMLLGHMDTVWSVGTLKHMPFRAKAGRLFGPGIYDMKGGIVNMLFAVRCLRHTHGEVPRRVRILLVSDEEIGSNNSRPVTEKLAKRSAAVLVCEPSAGLKGALKTARKGVGEYVIKVTGRAAHAGLDPRNGHSAIIELARQIERIAAFTDSKRGITVNPGIVRGGTRTNVVAAEAVVEVDARIARRQDASRLDCKFRALRPIDSVCRLEVTGGINRPPLERTSAVASLFMKARRAARQLGFHVDEASVGGASDGNFTAALGIPTLDGLGAVGEGAHALHESVLISEMPRRAALLARLIEVL